MRTRAPSQAQIGALRALDRRILRMHTDLLQRDGVRWSTLASLIDRGWARRIDLRSPGLFKEPCISFFVLTDAGAAEFKAIEGAKNHRVDLRGVLRSGTAR